MVWHFASYVYCVFCPRFNHDVMTVIGVTGGEMTSRWQGSLKCNSQWRCWTLMMIARSCLPSKPPSFTWGVTHRRNALDLCRPSCHLIPGNTRAFRWISVYMYMYLQPTIRCHVNGTPIIDLLSLTPLSPNPTLPSISIYLLSLYDLIEINWASTLPHSPSLTRLISYKDNNILRIYIVLV